MNKNLISKELLEKVQLGKKSDKVIIAGAALLAVLGGVGAVIYKKKKDKEIEEMSDEFLLDKGDFITLRACDLKAEPNHESETIETLEADEMLESVSFEKGWFRVKAKGKDGYLEKSNVVFFYSDFESLKEKTDEVDIEE